MLDEKANDRDTLKKKKLPVIALIFVNVLNMRFEKFLISNI